MVPDAICKDNNSSIPTFFKVYSKDGRESLTSVCTHIGHSPDVNQVSCKFTNVRFIPPEKLPQGIDTTSDWVREVAKTDPEFLEEVKKNPKKIEQKFKEEIVKLKREFCMPNSVTRTAIESKIIDPKIGPKRKSYYQQLIASCEDNNPTAFWKSMFALEYKTCSLWVDYFTIEFKKVKAGQWLYRQEKPGALSKVLKIYELTGDGLKWRLSETRVPMEGSKEKPVKSYWSWENIKEYELPCDFISHNFIQFPSP